MYIDGTSNKGLGGNGIVLKGANRVTIKYTLMLSFKAIDNSVKYEALVKGLDLAREIKLEKLNLYSDL